MQIDTANRVAFQPAQGREPFAQMKQSFEQLGSALETGSLSKAKEVLAQLQKNAPASPGNGKNPMRAKMEALSKAVDAGDLKAAQEAYTEIKKSLSQRPPPGGRMGGGAGGANRVSGASAGSNPNKVYDKKDSDKDGTISWKEKFEYSLKHPEEAKQDSASVQIDSDRGRIDAIA